METTLKVLDHGFVTLRNMSGPTRRETIGQWSNGDARMFDADDVDVANSARMSFDASDQARSYETEMKLNRYLMVNKHSTPFECIEVWLEMKLPIFVARQFVRHRTASINEVSGRYVTLPAEWYIPDVVGKKSESKKQGRADDVLNQDAQNWFKNKLNKTCADSYNSYLTALEVGVAPEQARLFLHLNHYTHWLFKMDLRNLFHFLSLRRHEHAQFEAREYADAIFKLLEPHVPGLMKLYQEVME